MSAHVHHGETVNAETVILAIVAAEAVVRNSIAVVSAPLLPVAMFRLPAMSAIPLPRDLLHVHLFGAPLLCRPVVLLLTLLTMLHDGLLLMLLALILLPFGLLLPLLILLPIGLLLLFRGVVLLLTLLALLILLPFGLLLPLLILLPLGLLLLFCRVVLLLMLWALLIQLPL